VSIDYRLQIQHYKSKSTNIDDPNNPPKRIIYKLQPHEMKPYTSSTKSIDIFNKKMMNLRQNETELEDSTSYRGNES